MKNPGTMCLGFFFYGVQSIAYTVYMTWASKRKLIIIGVISVVVALCAGAIWYFFFHTPPSCIDGKQNQQEEGIDCGGSCTYLCTASQAAPSVRFVRAFSPLPGRTDVIAYVDNPNTNAEAYQAPYTIELYNDQNVLVAKTQGVVDLPALSTAPVFVPQLFSGSEVVSHAFLTFASSGIHWIKAAPLAKTLETQNIVYSPGETPRVTATVYNKTAEPRLRAYFVATLFGVDGKALASSATIVDVIPAQGTNSLVFTWPTPITEAVARVDIMPVLLLPTP